MRMNWFPVVGWIVLGLLVSGSASAFDESEADPTAAARQKSGKGGSRPVVADPEEREKNALAFVKEHHPELAEILAGLKESKPQEYQKGLREIQGVSQRVSKFREKQPERYTLEVDAWKAGSRARLLAAQGAMSDAASDDLKVKIRTELLAQEQAKLKLLEIGQADLQNRLESVQEKLKTERDGIDARVAAAVEKLLNSARQRQIAIQKRKEPATRKKNAGEKAEPQTETGKK